MSSDEYVLLAEDAKDALGDLLRASEPGTGVSLHTAYRDLKALIEKHDRQAERAEVDAETQERLAGITRWQALSAVERDRQVLDALANDRLNVRQVGERALGAWACRDSVAAALRRLMDSGEVCRVEVPGYRGGPHPRWQYFRNAALDGPIADLERTFNEEAGA